MSTAQATRVVGFFLLLAMAGTFLWDVAQIRFTSNQAVRSLGSVPYTVGDVFLPDNYIQFVAPAGCVSVIPFASGNSTGQSHPVGTITILSGTRTQWFVLEDGMVCARIHLKEHGLELSGQRCNSRTEYEIHRKLYEISAEEYEGLLSCPFKLGEFLPYDSYGQALLAFFQEVSSLADGYSFSLYGLIRPLSTYCCCWHTCLCSTKGPRKIKPGGESSVT